MCDVPRNDCDNRGERNRDKHEKSEQTLPCELPVPRDLSLPRNLVQ
jgi:hypothetical protein